MDGWRTRLSEIMQGAQGRELTAEEVREVLAAISPEDRLPVLMTIRQLMSERPEPSASSKPCQRLRSALQA